MTIYITMSQVINIINELQVDESGKGDYVIGDVQELKTKLWKAYDNR